MPGGTLSAWLRSVADFQTQTCALSHRFVSNWWLSDRLFDLPSIWFPAAPKMKSIKLCDTNGASRGSRWLFGVSKGADTLISSQNQAMNAVFSLYFRILFCVSDWIFVFPNHSLSFRVKTQISNALWSFAVRRGVARARVRSREAAGVL